MKSSVLIKPKILAVTLMATLCGAGMPVYAQQVSSDTNSNYDVLFTIPKGGDTGVTYLYENTEEMLPTGPRRLIARSDGTFFIVDTGASRILQYDNTGKHLRTLSIPLSQLIDAMIFRDDLYAIASINGAWKLYKFSADGAVVESTSVKMPKSKGMQVFNTLKVNPAGDFVVEITDSDLHSTIDVVLIPYAKTKKSAAMEKSQVGQSSRSKGKRLEEITLNGQTIDTVTYKTNTHSLNRFSIQENGSFQIQTTEVVAKPHIVVDAIIRNYDSNGKLRGMARSPLQENYIHVPENIAVANDSSIYAMITKNEGVKVVRLHQKQSLETILSEPEAQPSEASRASLAYAGSPSELSSSLFLAAVDCSGNTNSNLRWRSRSAMSSQAVEYLNNQTSMSLSNMDPSRSRCSDRNVPDQFKGRTGPAFMPSVAYRWGGYDLPGTYNTAMSQNQIAGNAQAAFTSCGNSSLIRGVDCSGFVSRVWNVPPNTTRSLPGISTQINIFNLSRGDILNYAGSHVRLVDRIDGAGAYVWESTVDTPAHGYSSFDGVLYRYYPYNQLYSYTPYKYQCVQ